MSQRPRDWDPVLIQRMTATRDQSFEEVTGNVAGYYWALDGHNLEGASSYLDRALAIAKTLPSGVLPGLALEAAYFEARYRSNCAAAHAWLEHAQKMDYEFSDLHRAQAALLLAEGKHREGVEAAKTALAATEDTFFRGTALAVTVWLKEMIAQAAAGTVTHSL